MKRTDEERTLRAVHRFPLMGDLLTQVADQMIGGPVRMDEKEIGTVLDATVGEKGVVRVKYIIFDEFYDEFIAKLGDHGDKSFSIGTNQ